MFAAGCLSIPFDLFFVAFDIDKKAVILETLNNKKTLHSKDFYD